MKKNQNIAHALNQVVDQYGSRTALVVPAEKGYASWTFDQLGRRVASYAHALASQGIGKQDRAVLMVRPSLEFIGLTFALFSMGTPVVLIDPGMGYRNLLRCLGSVRPTVFIGIPRAQIFRRLFPGTFGTVRKTICVGPSCLGLLGKSLTRLTDCDSGPFATVPTGSDELAAIIFTTGSTGSPKGVCYHHGAFQAQRRIIREYYRITPEDIDQPAFPLFALFSTSLGACAVLPDMDAAHPAKVDPAKFIRSINDWKVSYSFGSPAIWNVVSRYCLDRHITLPSLQQVLMAGAPVPGELIQRVQQIIAPKGAVHTPYGATESLPVASITGREIVDETWELTRKGGGICVGRPVPGMEIRIIKNVEEDYRHWSQVEILDTGVIGEIVVRGPVVTQAYFNNAAATRAAKIDDNGTIWHRMGDLGYLDAKGQLWFCGRKAHAVHTAHGEMYTICCEAIFNRHPSVYRSALVGVDPDPDGCLRPVIIVEPADSGLDRQQLMEQLRELARANPLTRSIRHFMVHPEFPVDIRHNAKIFREKLALWAAEQWQDQDSK